MLFVFVTAAFLIAGGVLGAASMIVKAKPNAQELIDKLAPHQGYIGMVLFFWGIWDLIRLIGSVGLIMKVFPLFGIAFIVAAVTELLLGFLLGFGLITKYALSKNQQALEKGQAIRAKLAPFQGILGFVGIGSGLFILITFILKI